VYEFGFELRACSWAERAWHPTDGERPVLVGRQLGTRTRRWDTVVIEVDPDGLAARAAFGPSRLDSDLLGVVRHAPADWAWYRDALPEPDYPWRYVREAANRAADRGVVETRKRSNRLQLRRVRPYPDWVRRVVAVENKPDLDASAARALTDQLERDVALGLADEVWLATAATGAGVEPALLEDVPPEVGILALDVGRDSPPHPDDAAEVLWHAGSLAVDAPGTRVLERGGDGERDLSAARFEYADPDWKRAKRLELAERAYERGWRDYGRTMRPDCRHFELGRDGRTLVPHCAAKGRTQRPGECSGDCPEFEPEPPAWRAKGWPVEGGPGKGLRALLDRRRERRRPDDDA
jgi:hypothetical protein